MSLSNHGSAAPYSRASQENAFGKVHFRPANARNDQDEDAVDRAIAQAAVAQLRDDRKQGFDHRLFARASSIASAKRLVETYNRFGAAVAAIDSSISKRRQDQVEEALLGGQLDGVVCVDMFGEGYDFPKLKVAALHAPHRSLVPTLQFIGRFARTNGENTGDATLIAPISRVRDATLRLFQEGVDIAQLIDEAAQQQIADGAADREILEILKTKIQAESDYDAVSPLSLILYAHARVFECDQQPDEIEQKKALLCTAAALLTRCFRAAESGVKSGAGSAIHRASIRGSRPCCARRDRATYLASSINRAGPASTRKMKTSSARRLRWHYRYRMPKHATRSLVSMTSIAVSQFTPV